MPKRFVNWCTDHFDGLGTMYDGKKIHYYASVCSGHEIPIPKCLYIAIHHEQLERMDLPQEIKDFLKKGV